MALRFNTVRGGRKRMIGIAGSNPETGRAMFFLPNQRECTSNVT